ncbi:hypothetical protein JW868_02340, partial [Candidatus Woesearchaeota archaeon]|nr:hypothetical protein [Candidatus Woesearchaeota archaeon]
MIDDIISIYHHVNSILGTEFGELLKKSVEFLVVMIVLYMLVSEWNRTKSGEQKYLMIAFLVFAVQRLIATMLLLFDVFGDMDYNFTAHFFVLNNLFELVAILTLAGAFLYNYKRIRWWYKNLQTSFIIIGVLYIIIEFLWVFYHSNAYVFLGLHLFLSVLIMGAAIVPIILLRYAKRDRYTLSISVAFLMFVMAHAIDFINILYFNLQSSILKILAHPFPLVGVLLFTRVVYLKLADKATLKEKLKETTKKYEKEKQISDMKDEFISVISHELRTPLTSMNLYSSLLLEEKLGKVTDKQKFALSIIK